jgi:ParB/RepB/Spo0J family partition protein
MKLKYDEMKSLAKGDLIKFIANHPFQWFLTLTFKESVTQELARERLRDWTRKICRAEELQVAYIGVVNEESRCHCHLLMFGHNRWGKTLHKVSIERWAREWSRENCGETIRWNDGARIDPVYEIRGVSHYLIERNLTPIAPSLSDLIYYNKRLLMKCRSEYEPEAPPAITRNGVHKVTYLLRRNGEEYKKIKDKPKGGLPMETRGGVLILKDQTLDQLWKELITPPVEEQEEKDNDVLLSAEEKEKRSVSPIEIKKILTDLKHPRKSPESKESMDALESSIQKYGVLEPISVIMDDYGRIHLVDGKRRLEAAKGVGLQTVPVRYLKGKYPPNVNGVHLIKNFTKKLSDLDFAELLQELKDEHKLDDKVLCLMAGLSEKELKETLSIATLPKWVKERYRECWERSKIPKSTLVKIANMNGTDLDKCDEFDQFIYKYRRPKAERIKDRANHLTKTLERSKKEGFHEDEKKECEGELGTAKRTIDSVMEIPKPNLANTTKSVVQKVSQPMFPEAEEWLAKRREIKGHFEKPVLLGLKR